MMGQGSGAGSWLFPAKVLLLSTGVLSTAVAAKMLVPSITRFALTEGTRLYGSVLAWLTPPYLYLVINGIIITIAASSRFQSQLDGSEAEAPSVDAAGAPDKVVAYEMALPLEEERSEEGEKMLPPEAYGVAEPFGEVVDIGVPAAKEEDPPPPPSHVPVPAEDEEDEFVIKSSDWTPMRRTESADLTAESYSPLVGKPPASSRFGSRKSMKASPEGKVLGVARPRKNETLENTWKMITDGRPMPLARHLKKSDTGETHAGAKQEPSPVRKSETFDEQDATAPSRAPSGDGKRLRREASLSQDELNRRVEAFINKFNEEMRLQREESLKHYCDMVNGGVV